MHGSAQVAGPSSAVSQEHQQEYKSEAKQPGLSMVQTGALIWDMSAKQQLNWL